jgi:hypothetical protein
VFNPFSEHRYGILMGITLLEGEAKRTKLVIEEYGAGEQAASNYL